jgi:hypothetical protein
LLVIALSIVAVEIFSTKKKEELDKAFDYLLMDEAESNERACTVRDI